MVHRSDDGKRQIVRDVIGIGVWTVAFLAIIALAIAGFVLVLGALA